MKKLSKFTIAAALLTAAAVRLKPKKAYAWFSQTHNDITEMALDMFEELGKNKICVFYKKYREEIVIGSKAPDTEGDCDKGAGFHYYSYKTPKGKKLPEKDGYYANRVEKFSKSARTMCEENYTSALSLYKNGMVKEAMYFLGRAVHFVEDISCPVHTASMKYLDKPANPHGAFEKHANTIAKRYAPKSFDKRLVKSYSNVSLEGALNKLAQASNKFAPLVAKLDPIAFNQVVEECVPLSVQNVMALMMRFYDDCKADNGNFLVSSKLYSLRNEKSGLMITNQNGVRLEKLDHEMQQRFTLELYSDGAFSLKNSDGEYLSNSLKKFEKVGENDTVPKFKASFLGKKRYRITTADSSYASVVSGAKNNLSAADFVPGDASQVWIMTQK